MSLLLTHLHEASNPRK